MSHLGPEEWMMAADGREDLLSPAQRKHLDTCAECAAGVAAEAEAAEDLDLVFRRAALDLEDVEPMIQKALEAVPPAVVLEGVVLDEVVLDEVRPSRRALTWSAAIGGALSVVLTVLALLPSVPTGVSLGGLLDSLRKAEAFAGAVDQLVETHVFGGWAIVTWLGLLMLALTMIALRVLARSAVPTAIGIALLVALGSSSASALDFEGEWPAEESTVTIDVERAPLRTVLAQAADQAGLGLVHTLPDEILDQDVSVQLRGAALADLLDATLGTEAVVARRTSSVLVLRQGEGSETATSPDSANPAANSPDSASSANSRSAANSQSSANSQSAAESSAEPIEASDPERSVAEVPDPPTPPRVGDTPPEPDDKPEVQGERVTFGADVHVRAGERVREVVTMGGSVIVEGEVVGDVVTMGGDVEVRPGGNVLGEIVTMGGEITIHEGGQAQGGVVSPGRVESGPAAPTPGAVIAEKETSWFEEAVRSGAKHAVPFLVGLFLMAVAPKRFGTLRRQLRQAPFRSFFTGALGLLACLILGLVLMITIVGIPAALGLGAMTYIAVHVGQLALAFLIGSALPVSGLRDKPIHQLVAGLLLLFFASLLPVVAGVSAVIVTAAGFGAILLTRFGTQTREEMSDAG
ncbi:MAG: hypothetical protein AAGF12_20720 [Myxococcota bacterium]